MNFLRILKTSVLFLFYMTVLTGILYTLAMTGIGQAFFSYQANGSILTTGDKLSGTVRRGSALLGQSFSGREFFKSRPSAADYVILSSGASNLGQTSSALRDAVAANLKSWNDETGVISAPGEMLYASASGLDPDISLESALAQVPTVTVSRKYTQSQTDDLKKLIADMAEKSDFSWFGIQRVNVTLLNYRLETDPRFTVKN